LLANLHAIRFLALKYDNNQSGRFSA